MTILKFLKNIFTRSKKLESSSIKISSSFEELEKITRSIFSPVNIKKDDSLRNNSFTTPSGKDEISVNRLDYTTPDFIKKLGKLISNPEHNRSYYGVAVIDVGEIYECKSDIVYSPTEIKFTDTVVQNPFHSDIKIGFEKEVGKPLPMNFAYKVEQMVNRSRFYKDHHPHEAEWLDGDLK